MDITEKVEKLNDCYCEVEAIRNTIKPLLKTNPYKHPILVVLNNLQSLIDVEIKKLEHGE